MLVAFGIITLLRFTCQVFWNTAKSFYYSRFSEKRGKKINDNSMLWNTSNFFDICEGELDWAPHRTVSPQVAHANASVGRILEYARGSVRDLVEYLKGSVGGVFGGSHSLVGGILECLKGLVGGIVEYAKVSAVGIVVVRVVGSVGGGLGLAAAAIRLPRS